MVTGQIPRTKLLNFTSLVLYFNYFISPDVCSTEWVPNNYNINFGERLRALALLNSPLLLTEKEDKLAQNRRGTNNSYSIFA